MPNFTKFLSFFLLQQTASRRAFLPNARMLIRPQPHTRLWAHSQICTMRIGWNTESQKCCDFETKLWWPLLSNKNFSLSFFTQYCHFFFTSRFLLFLEDVSLWCVFHLRSSHAKVDTLFYGLRNIAGGILASQCFSVAYVPLIFWGIYLGDRICN